MVDITNIIEEIQQLNSLDGKSIPERVVKFNEEFGEFNAELCKFIGITHKPYDKPHLIEEMADAMQNLCSVYLAVCAEAGIDFQEIVNEIEVKNKKWREKVPLYTRNKPITYKVRPWNLIYCEHVQDRKIGSNWCLDECPHNAAHTLSDDPHGRTDWIEIVCNAKK